MIPGFNILDMALSVIATQTVAYYQYSGRALNNVGQDVNTFAAPIFIDGSLQPVPRQLYQQFGLDFSKDYQLFYVSKNILDLNRDVSGDQIVFDSQRYQCEQNVEWFAQDGWVAVLCCRINIPTDTNPPWGFNNPAGSSGNQNFNQGEFHNAG